MTRWGLREYNNFGIYFSINTFELIDEQKDEKEWESEQVEK